MNAKDFLIDQIREVDQARDIAWIQTMAFEPGHFSKLLVESLVKARKRGVDVRFVCDAYSDYVAANSFNHLRFLLSPEKLENQNVILERRAILLAILKNQCSTNITNVPNKLLSKTPIPAFLGRDHKKISIIDDTLYLGGSNLTPLDAERADVMLKTDNHAILRQAKEIFLKSFSNSPAIDQVMPCDNRNKLLVDSGMPGKSVIMDYVCKLAGDETSKITVVSPYIPIGRLRKILNSAHQRGVDVELITSDESQLGFAPKLSQLVHSIGQKKPLFAITRCPAIIHAKIVLLGDHTAIVGSHNFDDLFVYFGTEEISLLTTQEEIITGLNNYISNLRTSDALSKNV